jgi:hypothetical protein
MAGRRVLSALMVVRIHHPLLFTRCRTSHQFNACIAQRQSVALWPRRSWFDPPCRYQSAGVARIHRRGLVAGPRSPKPKTGVRFSPPVPVFWGVHDGLCRQRRYCNGAPAVVRGRVTGSGRTSCRFRSAASRLMSSTMLYISFAVEAMLRFSSAALQPV